MTVVVGAAIVRQSLLLAAQRAYPASLAGRWELPGGQVEPGEAEDAALVRECREELAVAVRVGSRVGPDVPLPSGALLRVYAARLEPADAEPVALEHQALRWLGAGEVPALPWLPADEVLVPELVALLTAGNTSASTRAQRL